MAPQTRLSVLPHTARTVGCAPRQSAKPRALPLRVKKRQKVDPLQRPPPRAGAVPEVRLARPRGLHAPAAPWPEPLPPVALGRRRRRRGGWAGGGVRRRTARGAEVASGDRLDRCCSLAARRAAQAAPGKAPRIGTRSRSTRLDQASLWRRPGAAAVLEAMQAAPVPSLG